MNRHLNGVKNPLSQNDLQDVISRIETRFLGFIVVPTPELVILKDEFSADSKTIDVAHSEECRCDACVHAYLDAMEVRTAKNLAELQDSVEVVQAVEESLI